LVVVVVGFTDEAVAARMEALFRGHPSAHGTYEVAGSRPDGKAQGKALTVRAPVTVALWAAHLAGDGAGLGIIPIDPESQAQWGCIDIDTYPLDHRALVAKFSATPVVICRSKSGGAHVFLFLRQPTAAGNVREALRRLAASTGYGNCEIFPKQSVVYSDRGDLGNWLNMPYQAAAKTMRYAFGPDGEPLDVDGFLALAHSRRVAPEDLDSIAVTGGDQDVIVDGPPCLEMLAANGIPAGTRNNGLFAFGVYFRKTAPDDWEQRLEEFNRVHLNPPKASAELQQIIRSLRKKDYGYRCSEPPVNQFCDRATCLTRAHGISGGSADGTTFAAGLGALTKQNTDPPLYWLDVEGGRIELSTEDLLSQSRFQKKCVERLNILPPRMRDPQWQGIVAGLLGGVTVIEAPHDASIEGLFCDLVEQYCVGRHQAKSREEILLGKPYLEDDKILFRMSGLRNFLQSQKFLYYEPPVIMARLRDMGATAKSVNFKGRVRSVWSLPAWESAPDIDPPVMGEKQEAF
jgi:hypothetical protein